MEHQQTHPQPTGPGGSKSTGDVTSPVLSTSTNSAVETIPRKACASGQVYDVDGSLWDVCEARATKHGFDFLYGNPANRPLSPRRRSRYIVTPALVAYFQANRTNRLAIYDLPVSRTVVQKIRRSLGFNFIRDRRSLWRTRAADMKKLRVCEFAKRIGVSSGKAYRWRALIVGPVRRPRNWWRDPAAQQVLRSNLTLGEMGKKLGISIWQAQRARRRALASDLQPAPPSPLLPWQTPAALEVLRSNLTNRKAAETLGLSVSHAQRLRRALALDPKLAGQASRSPGEKDLPRPDMTTPLGSAS